MQKRPEKEAKDTLLKYWNNATVCQLIDWSEAPHLCNENRRIKYGLDVFEPTAPLQPVQ